MFNNLFKGKKVETVKTQEPLLNESFQYSSENEREEQFYKDLEQLKLKYKTGQIPKLNSSERKILEFCHERDMTAFLKEEFEKHPINLDEDGCLIGENPFEKERRLAALQNSYPKPSENASDYEIL